MYKLTDTAAVLANHFLMIMSVVMVGMSYQMPVSVGVIQGGGDTRFSMYMNMISTWGIVMPLSFLAAFVWKLPGGTGCGCSAVRSVVQGDSGIFTV